MNAWKPLLCTDQNVNVIFKLESFSTGGSRILTVCVYTLLFHKIGNIRIVRKTTKRAGCRSGRFKKCRRLSRKMAGVQFIERNHATAHYPRQEMLKSCPRGFI